MASPVESASVSMYQIWVKPLRSDISKAEKMPGVVKIVPIDTTYGSGFGVTSLSQDGYVVGLLSRQTFRKRTNAYLKELKTKIQAVTAADIERVAKKYIEPKRLVIVDAGDQSKAGPKK